MIQIKQIHSNEAPSANDLSTNNITESDVLIVDNKGNLYVTYLDNGTLKAKPIKAIYSTDSAVGNESTPVYVNAAGQIQPCGAVTAEKLETSAGSSTEPIYFNAGKPAACSAVSVNRGGTGGTDKASGRTGLGIFVTNTNTKPSGAKEGDIWIKYKN